MFPLQQITALKKENFNLKLRIYFLEERVQQKCDDSTEDIYKTVTDTPSHTNKCTCSSLHIKASSHFVLVDLLLKFFIIVSNLSVCVEH